MLELLKDTLSPLISRKSLVIAVICATLAATTGPFGTYEIQTFWLRLIYWSLVTASSLVIGALCLAAAESLAGADQLALADVLTVVIMVPSFTPVLWVLTHSLLQGAAENGPTVTRLSYYVAVVTVFVCIFRRVLPGFGAIGYFAVAQETPTVRPRLMRRLTQGFRGPVVRMTVRDHFVDVVSETNTETLRMRFADAVQEMEPIVGHCTHRSHWVALDAIVGVKRGGGKITLKLSNGDHVPVSRTFRPELEKAGVL